MKASGNGTPQTCVQNLLKTTRGEVPYERIKGIDRTLIDKPSETAATDLAADVAVSYTHLTLPTICSV